MSEIIRQTAGERLLLSDESLICRIDAGSADVFITKKESEQCVRQMYLMKLQAGDYFFASMDEFRTVEIFSLSLSEVSLTIFNKADMAVIMPEELAEIRKGMKKWFRNLVNIKWLRFMADTGDEIIKEWDQADFLAADKTMDALWDDFCLNQSILAMLLGGQFKAEEKYFDDRLLARRQQHLKLDASSVCQLLDDEEINLVQENTKGQKLDNVFFVVRQLASHFQLDTKNINLPVDIVKNLSQIGLIRRLISKGNMQIRLIKFEDGWQKKDSGVMLGYYGKKKELAAIIPDEPKKYRLYTLRHPQGLAVDEQVAANLDDSGFACYAGLPQRKLKVMDLWKFMFRNCWRLDYKYIVLASFIAGIIPLLTPIITETIFSDIIPVRDRSALATVTQVMMIAGFTTAAVNLVRNIAVLRISMHIDMSTESALWIRLLSLPSEFFRKYQAGEIAKRMESIDAIKSVLTGDFVSGVFNAIFSIWSVLLMCYYSLKLTVAAIVVWLVYFLVTGFIYRRMIKFQALQVKAQNKTSGQVLQIFNGLTKFRLQNAESQAFHLWAKCFGQEFKWTLKLRWQSNYSQVINAVQPILLSMLLYFVVSKMLTDPAAVASGSVAITYPEFLGFQAAFSSFDATLVGMVPMIMRFFTIQPHIENIRTILETEPEVSADRVDAPTLSGVIEVSHLRFGYEPGKDVLRDVSFKINAGESVGIVGTSGCGKSTLLRHLLGFEQPRSGAVYFDGMDMNDLTLASVRSQMGVVLQNSQLLAGDLYTNIIGMSALTMEDAWQAARNVGLDRDIDNMPMGMNTMISEGGNNISGGQRQRILLARSIVNKPRIIILDEATSALDNETQAIVTSSLEKMNCTRIMVAHRLSTIRNVDRILVMDKGAIAETGSFDELMAQNGIFASLAKRQIA